MNKLFYVSFFSSFFIIFFYIFYNYKIVCLQHLIKKFEKEKTFLNESIYKINNKIHQSSSAESLLSKAKENNYIYIKDQFIHHV
jgi:hypothetical protein